MTLGRFALILSIVSLIASIVAFAVVSGVTNNVPVPEIGDRFELTGQKYDVKGSVGTIEIMKDNETGILYMYFYTPSRGSITPLLDSNGKPMKFK